MLTLDNKNILWIYWGQGWNNAPLISKLCLQSWYNHNALDYLIMPIDDIGLTNYIDLNKLMPHTNLKNIDRVAMSDIIRLALISTYGGIWVDSTVLCLKPLKIWLQPILEDYGFFAYDKHIDRVSISSWFIAAEKNNYVAQSWLDSSVEYWKFRKNKHIYFWVHELFSSLYKENNKIKCMWDRVPKLTASVSETSKLDGPHAFVPYIKDLCGRISRSQIEYINNGYNNNYCLKLTRHYDIHKQINNTNSTIYHILKKESLI